MARELQTVSCPFAGLGTAGLLIALRDDAGLCLPGLLRLRSQPHCAAHRRYGTAIIEEIDGEEEGSSAQEKLVHERVAAWEEVRRPCCRGCLHGAVFAPTDAGRACKHGGCASGAGAACIRSAMQHRPHLLPLAAAQVALKLASQARGSAARLAKAIELERKRVRWVGFQPSHCTLGRAPAGPAICWERDRLRAAPAALRACPPTRHALCVACLLPAGRRTRRGRSATRCGRHAAKRRPSVHGRRCCRQSSRRSRWHSSRRSRRPRASRCGWSARASPSRLWRGRELAAAAEAPAA